ncbi:hypothetical protein DV735_g411, partial [Chaetothyriales sp. CBS 134920]
MLRREIQVNGYQRAHRFQHALAIACPTPRTTPYVSPHALSQSVTYFMIYHPIQPLVDGASEVAATDDAATEDSADEAATEDAGIDQGADLLTVTKPELGANLATELAGVVSTEEPGTTELPMELTGVVATDEPGTTELPTELAGVVATDDPGTTELPMELATELASVVGMEPETTVLPIELATELA